MVRADGLPKPEIRWFLNGKPIIENENHKIETHTETQVTSTLSVNNYSESDVGIVSIGVSSKIRNYILIIYSIKFSLLMSLERQKLQHAFRCFKRLLPLAKNWNVPKKSTKENLWNSKQKLLEVQNQQ